MSASDRKVTFGATEKWAQDPERPVCEDDGSIFDDLPDHMVGVIISSQG
jgi:hypothetical protein